MKKTKILIFGFLGAHNVGDDIMLETGLSYIDREKNDVDIIVSYNQGFNIKNYKHLEMYDANVVQYPQNKNDIEKLSLEYDVLICFGGALIDDIDYEKNILPQTLGTVLMKIANLFLEKNKKVFLYGLSSNKTLKDKKYNLELQNLIDKAHHFSVRDRNTIISLQKSGIKTKNIKLVHDVLLSNKLNYITFNKKKTEAKKIGIVFIYNERTYNQLKKIMIELMDFLNELGEPYELNFIPFYSYQDNDVEYIKKITKDLKIKNYNIEKFTVEYEHIISNITNNDYIICMRYHASLISNIFNVKTLTILYEENTHYHNKINYLYDEYKFDKNLISLSSTKNSQLLRKSFENLFKVNQNKFLGNKLFDETIKLIKENFGEVIKKDVKNNKNIPILTVLVPVYNVEKYIDRCLFSLTSDTETLKNIEILIVNDGSKDNSILTAKKYEEKFPRNIKIIDKENGGHGSTINVGMKNAKGKYFRVIDSDDWVNIIDFPSFVAHLKDVDVDAVLTNYTREYVYDGTSHMFKYNSEIYYNTVYDLMDFDLELFGLDYFFMATTTFKTEVLRQSNFSLDEKTFYVDMQFIIFPFKNIQNFIYLDYDIYRYFIGRNDQSIAVDSLIKHRKDHEKVLKKLLSFYKDTVLLKNKQNYISKIIVLMLNTHYSIYTDKKIIYNDMIKEIQEFDAFLKLEHEDLYKKSGEYYPRLNTYRKTNFIFSKYFYNFFRRANALFVVLKGKIRRFK